MYGRVQYMDASEYLYIWQQRDERNGDNRQKYSLVVEVGEWMRC